MRCCPGGLIKARRGATRLGKNLVLVRGILVARRNRVECGKIVPFVRGVKNLVHPGDGQLGKAAELIAFVFRHGYQRTAICRTRVLDQAHREVLFMVASTSLARFGFT